MPARPHHPERSRIRCAVCARTSSISIRSIGRTPKCRSRKPRQAMADLLACRQNPRDRRQQFQSAQRWMRFASVAPLAHGAAAVQSVRARHREFDVLPYCRDNDIATLAYGALCRGLLSGRMNGRTSFAGDDLRRNDPKFQAPRFCAISRRRRKARPLRSGKLRQARHPSGAALDSRPPGLGVALWGARRPDQLAPSAVSWVGASMPPPWPKSIAFCGRRSRIRSARNSWRRRPGSPPEWSGCRP